MVAVLCAAIGVPGIAHADCKEVLAALGNTVVDVTCAPSADLTTKNPTTTPADNSIPGLPPGAFTPTTDRGVISNGPAEITKAVPGLQINGRFADDPDKEARFLLRLPNDWNGSLVVAGASGTRSEFNGDFAWSDYVVQKGYAYASQNKGVLNLKITSLDSATPPTPLSCRLKPDSKIWVEFFDNDAVRAQPGAIEEALGQRAWTPRKCGQGAMLRRRRRDVEHGTDICAGLRVLICDEIEQRARSDENGATADGAALIFERDLRASQRVDAGQRPARNGQDAIRRAYWCCM